VSWIDLRENQERVRQALQEGQVNEVVTLRATGFDKLAAAMHQFGYWDQLLRTPNPHQAPVYLHQDHGVLRYLGFTVAEIRDGFNTKGVRRKTGQPRFCPTIETHSTMR
jgi:hypothetical protein